MVVGEVGDREKGHIQPRKTPEVRLHTCKVAAVRTLGPNATAILAKLPQFK